MNIISPSFYEKFVCIAGKCDFTCCQQWKIGVDDKTYEKWKNIKDCGNCKTSIAEFTKMKEGQRVIALDEKMMCPLLREDGLCSVVLAKGEETISDTCHIFPRENHEFENHTERTLMPCCPYVIDLLNAEKSFEITGDKIPDEPLMDMGLFELRQTMMDYIQLKNTSGYLAGTTVDEMMKALYYMLLECLEAGEYDQDKWILMPELIETVRRLDGDVLDNLNECNELFLDIVDNYMKEGLYKQHLSKLCQEALKLEEYLNNEENEAKETDGYKAFIKFFSSYSPLIRKYLAQEFYADLFLPEGDLESVVIHFQWIAMEYVVIRHMAYLEYRQNLSENELSEDFYKKLRDYMVLTSRIMGYEEEDIYEYLENSFEELIWEWGYMGLIIGG